jgi:BNR repeat protein
MRRGFPRTVAALAVLFVVLPIAAASAGPYATTSVSQASSVSPFASCDVSGILLPGEVNWVNSELEPWVAVNPRDPSDIIGVYQQDRFMFGGARGVAASVSHDGGATWSVRYPHFSSCAGGTAANGGDYQRASDPWVTFSPDGTAYFLSLSLSFAGGPSNTGSAILVSKSTDGGDTWSNPVPLVRDIGDADVAPYYFNDKPSITADPFDSSYVYAVWDRLRKPGMSDNLSAENAFSFRGDTLFARSTDGGATWSAPQTIYTRSSLTGTIGNEIVVLPDGTLVDIFDFLKGSGNNVPGYDTMVMRSSDHGTTWSQPIEVAPDRSVATVDPDTGRNIRTGCFLPLAAVDLNPASPGYGNLYAVWCDSFGSAKTNGKVQSTMVFTQSTDGGITWSPLTRIDKSGDAAAFVPSLAIAGDGTVGVGYYDFRNNTPAPGLPTDRWLVHCHPTTDCTDPANWSETHVFGPFNLENAAGASYFLGDYEGMASTGTNLMPFFAAPTATDPDNTYLATAAPQS